MAESGRRGEGSTVQIVVCWKDDSELEGEDGEISI